MTTTDDPLPKLLRIPEAAKLLRIHRATLYRHHSNDAKFPRIRHICGRSLLARDELLAWIDKN